MKTSHKALSVVVVYMIVAAIASRGNTYVVKSEKPLQDIVVVCQWASSLKGLTGGTYSVTTRKPLIVDSGEKFNCGYNWLAGLNLSFKTYAEFMHPTYRIFPVKTSKDGVHIDEVKSNIEILDELKSKFEASDKKRSSGLDYARSSAALCGFPYMYFSYYKKVQKANLEHFKQLYNQPILECKRRAFPLLNKYSPNSYPGKRPAPEQSMESLWNSKWWSVN